MITASSLSPRSVPVSALAETGVPDERWASLLHLLRVVLLCLDAHVRDRTQR
jgi:hypothetical protein